MPNPLPLGPAILQDKANDLIAEFDCHLTFTSDIETSNLLSRELWVSRGPSLRLVLDVSLNGQPLSEQRRDETADQVCQSPVNASALQGQRLTGI
jgi:hypothetical protein